MWNILKFIFSIPFLFICIIIQMLILIVSPLIIICYIMVIPIFYFNKDFETLKDGFKPLLFFLLLGIYLYLALAWEKDLL